jgi:biotin carboxyl carrier protein
MPGLVIRYTVNVGDEVKEGDIVAVIEAMKMAIDLPSTVKGRVKDIRFKAGDHVSRDDILAVIG